MEKLHNNQIPGNQTNQRFLGGMFADRTNAESAYNTLRERGYRDDEIHLAMSPDTRQKYYPETKAPEDDGTYMAEGIGGGAEVGALVGIVAAVTASLVLPGVGLLFGPLAAGLIGAGGGALAGGFIGGLTSYGLPEEQARRYEEGIKEGKIFLGVHPKDDADARYIEENWKSHNGNEIYF